MRDINFLVEREKKRERQIEKDRERENELSSGFTLEPRIIPIMHKSSSRQSFTVRIPMPMPEDETFGLLLESHSFE